MFKAINNYFDVKFYLRFAVLFVVLYFGYLGFIGAITPSGTYYPFIDQHLNVMAWLRSSILYGAHLITGLFGMDTVVTHDALTDREAILSVQMDWPCYGVVNMSFWFAYVVAKSLPFRTKLLWAAGGLLLIWFFNCLRIAFLAIAIKKQWGAAAGLLHTNNHDLFNYFLYFLVFLLILAFERHIRKLAEAKTLSQTVVPAPGKTIVVEKETV